MTGEGKKLSRREALQRLGLGLAAAYIGPSFTTLSQAQAKSENSGSGNNSGSSDPSDPSPPSPPSQPSAPSTPTGPSSPASTNTNGQQLPSTPSGVQTATCRNVPTSDGNNFTISRRDYEAAQAAVRAGAAQPLENIWPNIAQQYPGRLIGIEFTGTGPSARYHFRAISSGGHLETIVVSAASGRIESIVGC